MRATDEVSEHLAELEVTLGEGPCRAASTSGGPVLASDLAQRQAVRRWPVFAPAARQAGAAAIFAFPLQVGAIQAGVMGLYRERPGPLSAFQLGDAHAYVNDLRLADVARDIVARRLRLDPDLDPSQEGPAGRPAG